MKLQMIYVKWYEAGEVHNVHGGFSRSFDSTITTVTDGEKGVKMITVENEGFVDIWYDDGHHEWIPPGEVKRIFEVSEE